MENIHKPHCKSLYPPSGLQGTGPGPGTLCLDRDQILSSEHHKVIPGWRESPSAKPSPLRS